MAIQESISCIQTTRARFDYSDYEPSFTIQINATSDNAKSLNVDLHVFQHQRKCEGTTRRDISATRRLVQGKHLLSFVVNYPQAVKTDVGCISSIPLPI